MTGRPGYAIPEGWEQIPGAAGCTLQASSYRERHAEFKRNRVGVYGLSSQTPESQKEAAVRLELSYPLLSDSMYSFSSAMGLPMLEVCRFETNQKANAHYQRWRSQEVLLSSISAR